MHRLIHTEVKMRFLLILMSIGAVSGFSEDFSFETSSFNRPFTMTESPPSSWLRYASVGVTGYPNLTTPIDGHISFGFRKLEKWGADVGLSAGGNPRLFETFLHAAFLRLIDENESSKYYGSFGARGGIAKVRYNEALTLQGLFSLGRMNSLSNGYDQFFELNLFWPTIVSFGYPIEINHKYVNSYRDFRRVQLGISYGWFF